MNMTNDLNNLRKKIDIIDNRLLILLSKRLALVAKIGEVKNQQGLSIYSPDREAIMLSACRKRAISLGISPDLTEDLLRRMMRASYSSENDKGFKTICPELRPIIIVGGYGLMGRLFNKMLKLSGYTVKILGQKDWSQAEKFIHNAGMVIISVPVHITVKIIKKLPKMPNDCILLDLTSIKYEPLQTMLSVHSGPVFGLHPMFSPDVYNLAKQLIIYCDGRYPNAYKWFLKQMYVWGVRVYQIDAIKHDYNMSFIQALRYFVFFTNGFHLFQEKVNIKELLEMSSSIYKLELSMIGRLFAQNPELYIDIIMSSKNNLKLIKQYYHRAQELIKLIETQDKESLMNIFKKISCWFGEYTTFSLLESRIMLNQFNDIYKK